jgi:radical SAM PhpK family P-methyltransferase
MPIVEIVNFVRQHNPEVKIIVGGPHTFNLCSTQEPEALEFVLQAIGADIYIYDSQGELTLTCVLNELRSSKPDLSRVPNLFYTEDKTTFKSTGRIIEDNDMDENSVDWSHFDREFYTPGVQIRTARSCAFSCSFCKYPAMAGRLNLTSLPVVERELRALNDAGVKHLVFIDDTFNVPLPRFKDLCRIIIDNKFEFDWYSFFRCSNSDDEAFDLMYQSRCKGVFLGIESGDPSILVNMNKFAKVDRYKYGVRMLKERGIATFASIIVGFPGETEETVRNTMEFLQEANPMFYRAELYYHYTNVPIHQQADKFGIRGAGYSWKHNTMDWRQASEWVKKIYRTVDGPSVLPGYMFDFWSIPYLIGRGFTLEQVKGFTQVAQEILVKGFDDPKPDITNQERRLNSLFQGFAS